VYNLKVAALGRKFQPLRGALLFNIRTKNNTSDTKNKARKARKKAMQEEKKRRKKTATAAAANEQRQRQLAAQAALRDNATIRKLAFVVTLDQSRPMQGFNHVQ
jgi:hypothetical protein